MLYCLFFFYLSCPHRSLHSFPTRRSSDLPYFRDLNDNGYREQFQDYFEPVNDIFSRMGEGSWHWGTAGEVKVGVDIGSNFSRLSSIEFGYYFYYFPNGIQIMMHNQPDRKSTRLNCSHVAISYAVLCV